MLHIYIYIYVFMGEASDLRLDAERDRKGCRMEWKLGGTPPVVTEEMRKKFEDAIKAEKKCEQKKEEAGVKKICPACGKDLFAHFEEMLVSCEKIQAERTQKQMQRSAKEQRRDMNSIDDGVFTYDGV